jgi:DNA-binding transcriptional ArsR family regulator
MATPTLENSDDVGAVFAALGHPARRAIVTRLGHGDATISELAEPFAMTLPAVSKHLVVLERAGIITRARVGRSRRCTLTTPALESAETWLTSRREFWAANLQSFASFVEGEASND